MSLYGQNPTIKDDLVDAVQSRFEKFVEEFRDESEPEMEVDGRLGGDRSTYIAKIAKIFSDEERSTVYVDMGHVMEYDEELATAIELHYNRVHIGLRRAVVAVIRKHLPSLATEMLFTNEFVLQSSSMRISVTFFNIKTVRQLRSIRSAEIGRLICFSGTITRASEVHPELVLGAFRCALCFAAVQGIEQINGYTEPCKCSNPACSNQKKWNLDFAGSVFLDWQKLRVQEPTNVVPPGTLPRSLDVIVRGDMCDIAKPGDQCNFTGSMIALSVSSRGKGGITVELTRQLHGSTIDQGMGNTGLRAYGSREFGFKLVFVATGISTRDNYSSETDQSGKQQQPVLSTGELEELKLMQSMVDELYKRMANSIAPAVYGHEEIKRGIVLMLFGGVKKTTIEGIPLRGDINVCIVGDPSTAKSQFLKYISTVFPRSVYTSGKASSASGLTAAVIKDPDSGEFGIEAGALMLADNGVCCIDEFDKMDLKDQVAIHEAMEQQTISITKAGIQATLNARCSILAAANPVGGRYNKAKSLRANIYMSAPIMSRFDLFFVLVDECEETMDYNIAKHITALHQQRDEAISPDFNSGQLQRYIRFARWTNPVLTKESAKVLVESYRRLRQNDVVGSSRSSYRITVRQLESLVRLSEALARLHLDEYIQPAYVYEAVRLLKKSIIHLDMNSIEIEVDEGSDMEGVDIGGPEVVVVGDAEQATPRSPTDVRTPLTPTSLRDADDEAMEEESDAEDAEEQRKRRVSIAYEAYWKAQRLILNFLQRHENRDGVLQQQVIEWYFSQLDTFQTEAELLEATKLVKHIIQNMVTKEHSLVVLNEPVENPDDRILAINANFVLDGV